MAAKKKTTVKYRPAPGYVLIEPRVPEKKTASGIYLPESSDEKPQEGKVLAVGDPIVEKDQKINSPAKVGQTVIYKKWGGTEIKLEGTEYIFAKFDDILAISTR